MRSAAVVLSLIATTSTGVGLAQASAPRTTHLAIGAEARTVHVSSPIAISGTVTPRVAGVAVYLQRYESGHWVNLTHVTTSAKGSYGFSIRAPHKPTTWIFRVARRGTPLVSHTLHVKISKASFRVSATATPQVAAGKPLVVTGSVTPKATGTVRLQILRGSTWSTLASASLTKRSTFRLSASRPAGAYRLRVVKPFSSTIATGVSATKTVAVVSTTPPPVPVPVPPGQPAPQLSVTSPDDALLGLPSSRLDFSAVREQPLPPARQVTLRNTGSAAATVSGLAVTGADASSYGLAAGQPSTVTVPPGGSATVSVVFHPTAPTSCPSTADPYGVSDSNRYAALTFTSTDPSLPRGSVTLAGLVSCGFGGANEPVLHQVLQAFGYSTVVDGPGINPRFLTATPNLPGTDEITAPYFRAVDPSAPVTVSVLAHYSSPSVTAYHATGWYAKGAALPSDGSCNSACQGLFTFPADPSSTTYNQNQKLLPTVNGITSFTTSSTFGLFCGDAKDVVFSDDNLNPPSTSATTGPHDIRVYPAFRDGHVRIPNAYLVAVDTGRSSESKNHDFQDVVLLVRNVVPST